MGALRSFLFYDAKNKKFNPWRIACCYLCGPDLPAKLYFSQLYFLCHPVSGIGGAVCAGAFYTGGNSRSVRWLFAL